MLGHFGCAKYASTTLGSSGARLEIQVVGLVWRSCAVLSGLTRSTQQPSRSHGNKNAA